MGKILKYQIVLQKYTNTAEEGYAETKEWCFFKETWADVIVRSAGTSFKEEGSMAFTRVEFRIRYDERINMEDYRIVYNNQYYYISHVETIDRKHWMKIISVNWEDKK